MTFSKDAQKEETREGSRVGRRADNSRLLVIGGDNQQGSQRYMGRWEDAERLNDTALTKLENCGSKPDLRGRPKEF